MSRIALLIPCYNERNRLAVEPFKQFASHQLQFIFMDDGSKDQTYEFLQSHFGNSPHMKVLRVAKNGGKAEAIRQAMLHLAKEKQLSQYDWIGYWDADLATPLSEVAHMLAYRELFYSDCTALLGSRVARLGSNIKRSYIRHYLGRIFATAVDLIVGIKPYDSQCGAKIFKSDLIELAFSEPFLSNWIFDIEILLRLKNERLVEYPLQTWQDVPGSKVKVSREIFRVLRDLYRIRKRYVSTHYS